MGSHFQGKLSAYGPTANTYDLLKFFAIISMVIDHVGVYLYPEYFQLRVLGRVAFPAFLFLVGYSKHWKREDALIAMACVLELVENATNGPLFPLNILFTIVATRYVMGWLEVKGYLSRPYICVIVAGLFILPTTYILEYGTASVMYAIAGYCVREFKASKRSLFVVALVSFIHFVEQSFLFLFTPMDIAIFGVEMLVLATAFYFFQLRPVISQPGFTNIAVRFLGRNSLYVYVIHVIILRLISVMLHPELYPHYRVF